MSPAECLRGLITVPFGWLQAGEPIFRHWRRLPQQTREILSRLKSDDIAKDNWHLRR